MYKALDIAKYVVTKCTNDRCPVTNLHLQKILYYLQKGYLDMGTDGLFEDEIQAWKFGPVVEEVYFFFCSNGAAVINKIYDVFIDEEDKKNIDSIVDCYKLCNPWQLVRLTHGPEKAWAQVFRNGLGLYDTIPKELILKNG